MREVIMNIKCPKCGKMFSMEEYNEKGNCSECGCDLTAYPELVNQLLRRKKSGERKYTRIRTSELMEETRHEDKGGLLSGEKADTTAGLDRPDVEPAKIIQHSQAMPERKEIHGAKPLVQKKTVVRIHPSETKLSGEADPPVRPQSLLEDIRQMVKDKTGDKISGCHRDTGKKTGEAFENGTEFRSNHDGYYDDVFIEEKPVSDRFPVYTLCRVLLVVGFLWGLSSFLIYYV